jgi:hypothetical protein
MSNQLSKENQNEKQNKDDVIDPLTQQGTSHGCLKEMEKLRYSSCLRTSQKES